MSLDAWGDAAARQVASVAAVFVVVLALDALAARGLPARVTARVRLALWSVFLLKLAWPFAWAQPWSVAGALDASLPAAAGADARAASTPSALAWGLAAWIVGVLATAAWAVRGARRTHRAFGTARTEPAPAWLDALVRELAARAAIDRVPRVRVGPRQGPAAVTFHGAAIVGLVRPRLVVSPQLVTAGPSRALEHVLLHELAHLARRDAVAATIWTVARCAYWFHPCVHVAAARAALAREMACDERAAAWSGGSARAYRATLLELARPLATAPRGALAYLGGPSHVLARLERLSRLESAPVRAVRRLDAPALAAFALACLVVLPTRGADGARAPIAGPALAGLPSLDDVDGCLRKRYLVWMASAEREPSGVDRP